MTRRLHKTPADYVVIAISPVLIMLLVGSLLFFLVEVFYRGRFSGRMFWIFFWFTIAIVLIGRISIELGKERAGMYAAALAVAVFLTMGKFAGGSMLVTMFLIGLIWWSAHKLVWDCTLIDETEDATGEGLMQSIGLDESLANKGPPVSDEPVEKEAEPEGVSARDATPSTWWERFIERRRRPHSPGVWVVYFSLAALPVFGIGHWFIRDPDARRYAFLLLLVYVASGLGLLLTTSFLGLRRYLRQRHLEMPPAMAGVWIGIGCALIVGLLFVSVWLPRPGAELVAELPFSVDSPTQESSRYDILGGEAADKDKGGPRSGASEEDQESPPESERDEPGSSGGSESEEEGPGSGSEGKEGTSGPGAEGEKGSAGSESDAEGESSQAGSREREGGSPSKAKSGKKGEGSESKGGERGEQSKSSDRKGKENGGSRSQSEEDSGSRSDETDEQRESRSKSSGGRGRRQSQRRAGQGKKAEQQTAEDDRPTRGAPKRPPLDPRAVIQSAGRWIATLFKWLFYGLLIAVVVYGLWRSRAEVLAALRGFLQGWREFWQRLFGGKPQAASATAATDQGEKQTGPRPFADFADPFLTGAADRYSADELVSYSFEAIEAWARERGWPREPDQTPHEFAQQLGTHVGSLSQDVRRLADLYCRVAYAPGTLPQRSVAPLRDLWHHLHLTPGEQSPAPPLFSPR